MTAGIPNGISVLQAKVDAMRKVIECDHPEDHWHPVVDPLDPDFLDPWYGCDLCGFQRQQDDDVEYGPDCPWEWRIGRSNNG